MMLGTGKRSKTPKRPRCKSLELALVHVPDQLSALRQGDRLLHAKELIYFLRTRVNLCHPSSDVGWWCCYEKQMKDLVTYLSEPESDNAKCWSRFREEVATQLSLCRQCAMAYHKAVNAWELSNEVCQWPNTTIRKRVSELVQWDAHRLMPEIEKGATFGRQFDVPVTLAKRTQCREAFLESLLSLRLCMHQKFCQVLGKVFYTRPPARDDEDVVPFIKAHGIIPPGLSALCFHSSRCVREWAKAMFSSCRKHLPADEQALQLLISKSLRLAQDKATASNEDCDTKSDAWAPDLHILWEGLDTLLTSMSPKDLEAMIKRNKKFPVLEVIFVHLTNAGKDSVTASCQFLPQVLHSLGYVLQSVPFASLFGCYTLSPGALLDVTFNCFNHSCDSHERRLLLDVLLYMTSSSTKQGNKRDTARLFVKCFAFLEAVLGRCSRSILSSSTGETFSSKVLVQDGSRRDILTTGARLLHRFYCHSSPNLPLDDPKRITDFVTNVVREIPERECSWDLLRIVLLTDVFILVRCIYDPREVEMIASTFMSFHAERGTAAGRGDAVLENALRDNSTSPVALSCVEGLWHNVRDGFHPPSENEHSQKVQTVEMNLIMDLHRLVGVLDPKRCGDNVKVGSVDHSRSGLEDGGAGDYKLLISQHMKTVQETIAARMHKIRDIAGEHISLEQLPFHAAHLLSSSRGEVARQAHLLLQKRYKIHNATCARPKSRDKLLVHILGKDKHDCQMMVDGFMSAMRINSAQGAAISARAYLSFFRWYCLLASRDCRILCGGEVAKGALGVLLTFLEKWKEFESSTTTDIFREVVYRLFTLIPDIWNSVAVSEENTERQNKVNNEGNHIDVSAWVRKVISKLLTMHDLKDELARGAWLRMITHENLKLTLKSIDTHHATVMGIIRQHETRLGSLEYVHCRKLADAFDIEEANQVLDRWAVNEARRTASLHAKGSRTKDYRDSKIDHFFSSALCGSMPLDSAAGRTASASNKLSASNRLQRRTVVSQKRQIGQCSTRPVRTNGSLHELRRDHRQARAELRRSTTRPEAASGHREPAKTRFELLRAERIAEKEKRKAQVIYDGNVLQPSEFHLEEVRLQKQSSQLGDESAKESVDGPIDMTESMESNRFVYPEVCRHLHTRSMEQVKRDILMSKEPHSFETAVYMDPPPETFHNLEAYVSYWEPLLIAEFRAGIKKKVEEEKGFAEHNKGNDERTAGCRAFEVDGPSENIGYLQTLSITSRRRDSASLRGRTGHGVSPFDVAVVQVSDIVMLEISGAGHMVHSMRSHDSEVTIAIVSNVLHKKGELRLTLRAVFDNAPAPGKGRLLKVSKLLSFATLQRQLDALWSLSRAQDGILWSLLDPVEGWRLKRELETRDESKIERNCALPLQVVQKMESLGVLNASQGRAITDVVRSCSCLFRSLGGAGIVQYTKHTHGSLSLIQGPPGTGKTSTIIALLSALHSCLGAHPYRRKAKVSLGGKPHTLSIPALRVLVCAPSNAAVDELMLRVMEDGLFTASGDRVCPRLVRVGRGATVESLKALEIHSLAKCEDEQYCLKTSTPSAHCRDHRKLLEQVSKHIEELDGDRRKISSELDRASERNGSVPALSRRFAERLREIREKLTILHDKKKVVLSMLSHEREAERKEEASRKREDMRTICNTLAAASIVFATLSSSGHDDMKNLGAKFDIVIIDEAGQSCEPEGLIPMTLGQHVGSSKQRFMHTVLVGDPKQLPATVISSNCRVGKAMGRSLFERIALSDRHVVHLLDTQYRMHPKISSFPSERFYNSLLCDSAIVKNKNMHMVWHQDGQKRFGPLTFFDTANAVTRETRSRGGSLSNNPEAKLVIEGLISMVKLYRVENLVDRIVVLSPYKQQVLLLQRLVSRNAELRDAKVEISTIDGIQGREKSIVLLSTVRSGHSKNIGFVKDDRRMNVALTRAKHTLMIFGHADFLSTHSDSWAALVSHCRKHSQIITLTGGDCAAFPESRSGFCVPLATELPGVEPLSDINDDKDALVVPTAANPVPVCVKSAFMIGENVFQKDSECAVSLRSAAPREEPSLNEVACGRLPMAIDGRDRMKEILSRYHGSHPESMGKNADTIVCNAEKDGNRYRQQKSALNSTVYAQRQRLALSQATECVHSSQTTGRVQSSEKRNEEEKRSRRSMHFATSSKEVSLRVTSRDRQIHLATKSKIEGPNKRVSIMPQRWCAANHGAGSHSRERLNKCASQTLPAKGQHYHTAGNVGTNRAHWTSNSSKTPTKAAPPTVAKRSFRAMHSESLLPTPEPAHKRLRQDRYCKQGVDRRQGRPHIWRHPEQNRAESYLTQRRKIQTNANLQTRRQRGDRLRTQEVDMVRQSRPRHAHIPSLGAGHPSQAKKSRTAPGFSLAETQTKLKGTLDVARQARSSRS